MRFNISAWFVDARGTYCLINVCGENAVDPTTCSDLHLFSKGFFGNVSVRVSPQGRNVYAVKRNQLQSIRDSLWLELRKPLKELQIHETRNVMLFLDTLMEKKNAFGKVVLLEGEKPPRPPRPTKLPPIRSTPLVSDFKPSTPPDNPPPSYEESFKLPSIN